MPASKLGVRQSADDSFFHTMATFRCRRRLFDFGLCAQKLKRPGTSCFEMVLIVTMSVLVIKPGQFISRTTF